MWVLIDLFCRGGGQKKSTCVSGCNFRRYIKPRPWWNEFSFDYLNCKCCTNLQTRGNIYIYLLSKHTELTEGQAGKGRKQGAAKARKANLIKTHLKSCKTQKERCRDCGCLTSLFDLKQKKTEQTDYCEIGDIQISTVIQSWNSCGSVGSNTSVPESGAEGCCAHLYMVGSGIILKPLTCSAVMKCPSTLSFKTPP